MFGKLAHPSLRNVVADQSFFAHIMARDHECALKIYTTSIPDICHFFTRTKFLENKIYTEKTRKLRQNTQKIANFLR